MDENVKDKEMQPNLELPKSCRAFVYSTKDDRYLSRGSIGTTESVHVAEDGRLFVNIGFLPERPDWIEAYAVHGLVGELKLVEELLVESQTMPGAFSLLNNS